MDGHGIANDAGEGSEVAGSATSAADAHLEALNQNISMGANIQYNTMNINVVGGEGPTGRRITSCSNRPVRYAARATSAD